MKRGRGKLQRFAMLMLVAEMMCAEIVTGNILGVLVGGEFMQQLFRDNQKRNGYEQNQRKGCAEKFHAHARY